MNSLLKYNVLQRNAQLYGLGFSDRSLILRKTRLGSWILFDIPTQVDFTSLSLKMNTTVKDLIA